MPERRKALGDSTSFLPGLDSRTGRKQRVTKRRPPPKIITNYYRRSNNTERALYRNLELKSYILFQDL